MDFFALPILIQAFIIIGGTMALSVACMLATRRIVRAQVSEGHNDVAGFIYAVVGLMYGILVAFLVVAAWGNFLSAEQAVGTEAASVRALYSETVYLPQPYRSEARRRIVAYAEAVVNDDFPAMAHGKNSVQGAIALDRVRNIYHQIHLKYPQDTFVADDALHHIDTILDERTMRVLISQEGLSGILWLGLILGGIITIGFSFLFYVDNVRIQIVMTATLGFLISFFLFLTTAIDHPFRGEVHVGPDAFRYTLELIRAHSPV